MKLLLYSKCTAEQYELPEKLADAYMYIGECLLEQVIEVFEIKHSII